MPAELFLSTPSARRATRKDLYRSSSGEISIHALREEGDDTGPDALLNLGEFLSTPSARRATTLRRVSAGTSRFLSTPSARRATPFHEIVRRGACISIHALREEGDKEVIHALGLAVNFYPRPPRGGRPNQPAIQP